MKPIGAVADQIVAKATRHQKGLDWAPLRSRDHSRAPLLHWGATPELVAKHCVGLAYLATPYTREVLAKGKWSIERSVSLSVMASRHMVQLMRARVTAVSPIVMAAEALHAQCSVPGRRLDPMDHEFWTDWCRPLLHSATMIVVPNIPGWDRSAGVWDEVQFALDHNVPVFLYAGAG